jgi:hypothetical protein
MALPVKLQDVADILDGLPDEWTAYINRRTGGLTSFSEYDMNFADEGADAGVLPGWQAEDIAEAKTVLESPDFIALPSAFDIHAYSIMERFCLGIADDRLRDILLEAIRGRGAFQRFKELTYREGVREDWYAFRAEVLRQVAADFLESEGIPFVGPEPAG